MDALAADSVIRPPLTPAGIRPTFAPGWIRRVSASRISVAFLSLIWICLVGLADYWTGYERSMLIFYLIPIALGTWFVGRSCGLFLAALSIGTSVATDIASGIPQVRYWNELVGLSSY